MIFAVTCGTKKTTFFLVSIKIVDLVTGAELDHKWFREIAIVNSLSSDGGMSSSFTTHVDYDAVALSNWYTRDCSAATCRNEGVNCRLLLHLTRFIIECSHLRKASGIIMTECDEWILLGIERN